MKKRLSGLFWSFIPLGPRKGKQLRSLKPVLSKQEYADVRYHARWRSLGFHEDGFGAKVCPTTLWVQLSLGVEDKKLAQFVAGINRKVSDLAKLDAMKTFKKNALATITSLVAPNIVGMEAEKQAAALQLFAQDAFHILLLGDPGTGKTEVLRGIERLAPQSMFGLGSGASKTGLIGMYDGKEFVPGLLVEADEGLALIDELNLMKKEDRAGLYSAMEKGFVTYDKRDKHEKFDARIRVLATANPKADKFLGQDVKFLRAQLPFDSALLTRFHLVFLLRKAKGKELEQITRKIVRNDVRELADGDSRFVKEYVTYAEKLNVVFDDKYESMIVDFIEQLKKEEKNFLVEVGPRTVLGVIRMAKAFARARLSRNVSADDLENAMKLVKASLVLKG
ncbi:AAA domain-containing protein [Candidatus Woesearchaeota archaeon]|nr:AAA domain-containing protein [Candidatus Woesearchaeota archaeon]